MPTRAKTRAGCSATEARGRGRPVRRPLVTPSEERRGVFSPNGAFVAYTSNESGLAEVYVRPFPGPGPKRQVSTNGGALPAWSTDGREVLYWEADQIGRLMKVAFEPAGDAKFGKPQPLFEVPLRMIGHVAGSSGTTVVIEDGASHPAVSGLTLQPLVSLSWSKGYTVVLTEGIEDRDDPPSRLVAHASAFTSVA